MADRAAGDSSSPQRTSSFLSAPARASNGNLSPSNSNTRNNSNSNNAEVSLPSPSSSIHIVVPAGPVRRKSFVEGNGSTAQRMLRTMYEEQEAIGHGVGNGISLVQARKILCQFGAEVSMSELLELQREVTLDDMYLDLAAQERAAEAQRAVSDGISASAFVLSHISALLCFKGGTASSKSLVSSSPQSTNAVSNSNSSSSKASPHPHKKAADVNHVFIAFDNLLMLFEVWQSSASFRMFDRRNDRDQNHVEQASTTKTSTLRPDGYLLFAWHALILLASVVMALIVLESHISRKHDDLASFFSTFYPVEIAVTILFAVDIFVHAQTATMTGVTSELGVEDLMLVDDPIVVRQQYARGFLWVDLVAMVPLRCIFFTAGSLSYHVDRFNFTAVDSGCAYACGTLAEYDSSLIAAQVVLHLRLLKLLRVHMTLFVESGIATMSAQYIQLFYVAAEGLRTFALLLLALGTCCVILMNLGVPGITNVASSVYFIMTCFSTAGYGDTPPVAVGQYIFFCALFVMSALLNGTIIGNFVSFFQASDMESKHGGAMLQLANMLEYFHVPMGLQDEILQYYSHDLTTNVLQNYGYLFVGLPTEMQSGLELWSRLRLIQNLATFHDLHRSAKLQLCQALQKVTYCPEEYIVNCGEIGEEMFFLSHGFVDIYTESYFHVATLRQGSYFGEMAIMSAEPQKRGAHVKSITYSEVFVLRKDDFMEVLQRYPKLRSAVEGIAESRRQMMKSVVGNPAAADAKDDGDDEGLVEDVASRHSHVQGDNVQGDDAPGDDVVAEWQPFGDGNDDSLSIASVDRRDDEKHEKRPAHGGNPLHTATVTSAVVVVAAPTSVGKVFERSPNLSKIELTRVSLDASPATIDLEFAKNTVQSCTSFERSPSNTFEKQNGNSNTTTRKLMREASRVTYVAGDGGEQVNESDVHLVNVVHDTLAELNATQQAIMDILSGLS